jgi:signal transduction histidine kinase
MIHRILSTRITAQGLVPLRTRARQIGELFGLETMQRTRFVTALSEIARNTVQYAQEGTVTFMLDTAEEGAAQRLLAEVLDRGPGIADLEAALAGRVSGNASHPPMGIAGCQRLVDSLAFETPADGGTRATLAMDLPRNAARLDAAGVTERVEKLARRKPQSPLEELEQQNRDMMETLQELRAKQVELQDADERKNEFLAMLAHELRNPLSTLQLSLEMMRLIPGVGPERVVRQHEVMARQARQLTRLVEDLMDVSRVSRGKVELHTAQADVSLLAAEALEMVQAAIAEKGHEVAFVPWTAELPVSVDGTRIKQVLVNLIHNAARYTPPKGRIDVAVRREGSHAVIDVRDNGIGISADMLPHVFEIFVQGQERAADGSGGLGVGLTLARRLIEEHGGSVRAQSAGLGAGACFTVSLPLGRQGVTVPADASAATHAS